MPANPKYLTQSKSQRYAKLSAAILGGFLVTASLHLTLAAWLPHRKAVFVTYSFSLFLLWVALMCLPYLARNGWTCWRWYAGLTLVFSALTYLGTLSTP